MSDAALPAKRDPLSRRLFDWSRRVNLERRVAIVKREDVDVIERHRQRQAQPQDMRRDFGCRTVGRGFGKGVTQAHSASTSGVTA